LVSINFEPDNTDFRRNRINPHQGIILCIPKTTFASHFLGEFGFGERSFAVFKSFSSLSDYVRQA